MAASGVAALAKAAIAGMPAPTDSISGDGTLAGAAMEATTAAAVAKGAVAGMQASTAR